MAKREKHEPKTIRNCLVDQIPDDENLDFFATSQTVTSLNLNNFDDFIKEKDVALVMFYDLYMDDCPLARKHVEVASTLTTRPNHGYGGVNCTFNRDLCHREGIEEAPYYKMYSRGNYVGTIRDYESFTAQAMAKLVEACPVFSQPVCAKLPCQ